MPAQLQSLQSLRELIGSTEGYRNRNYLSFSLLTPGIPKGALSEISGLGKTDFLIRFLAEHPVIRVAWIEEQMSLFPYAVSQRQAHLERMLLIEAGNCSIWTLLQVLKSQAFGIVVFSSTTTPRGVLGGGATDQAFDEKTLRLMQLAAERSQVAMVFLSDKPSNAWSVSLQIKLEKDRPFRILKYRK